MAGRGRTTYNKRLKEQKRLEKRQAKAARRDARKAAKGDSPPAPEFELLESPLSEQPEAEPEESQPSATERQ